MQRIVLFVFATMLAILTGCSQPSGQNRGNNAPKPPGRRQPTP
jgi:hypothetical protein